MFIPDETRLDIPKEGIRLDLNVADLKKMEEIRERKLYLYGDIETVDSCGDEYMPAISPTAAIVKQILNINKADHGIAPESRKPIMLFINSPGGELIEGFPLISAIELSKTPVYTINIGEWCSMAFLIGITGHKRFSLPYMTFLMHESSSVTIGKISDMEAKLDYERKLNDRVMRQIVLKHSKMKETEYELVAKKEFYMLPEDALRYGFIDEIISDIYAIL